MHCKPAASASNYFRARVPSYESTLRRRAVASKSLTSGQLMAGTYIGAAGTMSAPTTSRHNLQASRTPCARSDQNGKVGPPTPKRRIHMQGCPGSMGEVQKPVWRLKSSAGSWRHAWNLDAELHTATLFLLACTRSNHRRAVRERCHRPWTLRQDSAQPRQHTTNGSGIVRLNRPGALRPRPPEPEARAHRP